MKVILIGGVLAPVLAIIVLGYASQQDGKAPATGPATENRFPPLKLPAGFKATLFACDPLIEYPSVISIGPKPGAIFVAIDYMTGLERDGKVKSEIRLVEDTDGDGYADKATAVAKGFNSIQGLAYHDDTLFVMHAPFLTSLKYDKKTGIAESRKDLLSGLGLKPEDNKSRLHCANGVVVGHDGWLYLALGDNGVNVPRPEGDRLIHNGGAILRCRPDGRDLHVFSTGLRNIYDIALDADLNVFTRDNENDGGTYMIRVLHSFFGANHGYPYDYEERPDHALKPIGDFGLGSSAGGVCYLETQFPKQYRGNLFFCEWGKSIVRYELNRAGSGFAPVKEIEFAFGDPKDTYPFKPTDIVVQRDGTMMVADYADGQRPKRGRGRIYHIKHAGGDAEPAKKQPKSDLDKLNSESYFDRWEAQLAFERRGDAGRQELGDAFRANKIGPRAINHALHALAKGRGGAGLGDMLALVTDLDPIIRLPAIRIIADLTDPILVKHKLDAGRGDDAIAKTLATLKNRDDPRVMREIVIALGRLRWADAPAWLAKNLTKPDDVLAHAAMQTLRRADNWPAVLKLLDQPADKPIRKIALRTITDQYDATIVDDLLARLKSDNFVPHRREYAEALARVYKKPGPWKYWEYRPEPRPVNTQAWERTAAIANALDGVLADTDFDVRLASLKRMQREKVPIEFATLAHWLAADKQPERVGVILAALAGHSDRKARLLLYTFVLNKKRDAGNRLTALDLYFKAFEPGANPPSALEDFAGELRQDHGPVQAEVLRRLAKTANKTHVRLFDKGLDSTSSEVRAVSIAALGDLRSPIKHETLLGLLFDKDVGVRRAAAGAAGKLEAKATIDTLLHLAKEQDVELRRACLESLRRLKEPRVVPLALKVLDDQDLGTTALECLVDLGGPEHGQRAITHVKRSPTADNLVALTRGLTRWGESKDLAAAVADLHGSSGILLQWQAGGPFSLKKRDPILVALGHVDSPPARDFRRLLAAGPEGRLALAAKADPDLPLWFAFADIEVPRATPVEFLGSSRGSFEVWLNGTSIYRRPNPGKFQIDSDRFAGTFEQGRNRVLVQAGADSPVEFHLRYRRTSAKAAHEKLTQAALSRTGNSERGRKVFFDKNKSQCILCHQMGGQGERIGPELSGVGGRFSRIYLVESILEPSRTIAPSFSTQVITLKNGKTHNGVKVAESETTVTLADNQGQKHVLAKRDIEEQNTSGVSTMPDGLELRLTEDEFVDLIAFLASQKK